jgi:hypothetical protein
MKYAFDGYKTAGILCLGILIMLVAQSCYEAPRNWKDMPSTDYLIKNPQEFECESVYVDGVARNISSEGNGTVFYLTPLMPDVFGRIKVAAPQKSVLPEIKEGETTINVHGTVRGGILYADQVSALPSTPPFEVLFNIMGLAVFIAIGLKEWRLKKVFPFLEAG